MKRYLPFFLFSLSIGLGAWLGEYSYSEWFIPKFWLVFAFFVGITLASLFIFYRGIDRQDAGSILWLLSALTLKFIGTAFFALIYLFLFTVNRVVFMLDFFSLYLLFSYFEVKILLTNLRRDRKT